MKKLLFTLATLFVSSLMMGQTNTENYVKTTSYQIKTLNGVDAVSGATLTNSHKIESINYFDGLGRAKQSIAKRAGGGYQDVITHIDYDDFGRQNKDYLPYAATSNGGLFRTDALSATNTFYTNNYGDDIDVNDPNPYSEKLFEASPINRVLFQGAPGQSWKASNTYYDHAIQFQYQTNTEIEVKKYKVYLTSTNNTYTPTLILVGNYNLGELYKTITKDENHSYGSGFNNTVEEFKNKEGQVLLKRAYNASVPHDTYYVYDDYGNLTYVIPPLASDQIFSGGTSEPYNISFSQSAFTGTTYGGGSIDVAINGDQIVTTFNASFIPNTLNGTPQDINAPCALPDMFLGYVQTSHPMESAFSASIENGKLKITSNYNFSISSMNCVLTNTLSTSCAGPTLNTDVLDNLCYQYKYDHRNRLIEKKIPGKGTATDWEEIVYNKLDQPILTRDPNLKNTGKWLFTKYDVLGRVAYTGLITNGNTRVTLQTAADLVSSQFVAKNTPPITIAGTTIYYNNGAYPILVGTDEIQTINYYDNYTFDKDILTIPATAEGQAIINYNNLSPGLTKGLVTGSKVRVLGTTSWITSITGYDTKARPIYAASRNNYLLTTDVVTSLLDFVGKVDKTITSHSKGTTSIITENLFTYDHTGRLIKQTQELNNTNVLEIIAENTYDELGQLIIKGVGGKTSRLQTVNYAYNIRGWLKQINDPASLGTDLFGFKINYNTTEISGSTPLYNGNISETIWKTKNDEVSSTPWLHRAYSYQYDPLNRIIKGDYKIRNSSGVYVTSNYSEYSLQTVTYDKNGNIGTLNRYPKGGYYPMDYLTYTYDTGNKLLKVVDNAYYINKDQGFKDGTNTGNDFSYDANGNMKTDANKGITAITYNHLNLPTSVTLPGGTISYIYDATGVKQRKVAAGTTTDYAGNYLYQGGTLQFFNHPEGYVENDNGTFKYHYQYKDHLGNIRLSYTNSGSAGSPNVVISEENNYYPFGLRHKGYNDIGNGYGNSAAKKYKFGGKELQDDIIAGNSLDWYDFSARNYDPALGRWMNIDPLAEQMRRHSPYNYAFDNPMFFKDYDGMAPTPPGDYHDREGNKIGTDGIDDKKVYLLNEGKETKDLELNSHKDGTLTSESVDALKDNSTEVGGLIVMDRVEESEDTTTSEITTTGDEPVEGYALEPGGPSTAEANQDKRIPEGVYDLDDYSSNKYADNFILSNDKVSKDRKILIHKGNYGSNTEGCIMPGSTKGENNVGYSKKKMGELRNFIKSKGAKNVKLIINNIIPK
jgi:RHS repeat-associated protein